ncbi:cytochrome c biogenesis protein CcdC [Brevibacillus humidisoli]|uniref:CcdC family protein n=1 Tax=Brevibacillus humidisoli TaxID=2895522 RepID=UPI001E338798|nr:cytochrome c biogenesis protein CcdC [Brevibacillus humidisoli]UFJ41970.1 cytochrome c biogenesis protein CcdC [Brevibacillus humidisoli]
MSQLFTPAVVGTIAALILAAVIILIRLRAAERPVSSKKILLPPLMMTTGFSMFHFPEVLTPISYDLVAFLAGMLFSIPLILSSRFEVVGEHVYLKRSKAFIGVLLALFVIRLIVKVEVGDLFTPMQTAGLFFVLAYGMILPWRIAVYIMYRQIVKNRPV